MFADHHLSPQEEHVLNLTQEASLVIDSSLHSGGANPRGETLALTNYYMIRNGRPSLPITGEFHYSRFPHQYWEEELRKIQA